MKLLLAWVSVLFYSLGVEAAQSCTSPANGGCGNGSKCALNSKGLIYCKGCPNDKFTGFRCEIPVSKKQSCTSPANGGCRNGSKCTLNSKGLIYCKGCPKDKFTGFRCETPVSKKQSCTSPANGGCRNGSKCTLNSKGLIYCRGCPAGYSGFRCEKGPAAEDALSFCGVNDPVQGGKGILCPGATTYCTVQVSSGGSGGYQCASKTDYVSHCYPTCSAGQLCVNGSGCGQGPGCSTPCPTGQICALNVDKYRYECRAGPACSPACKAGNTCTLINSKPVCVASPRPGATPAPTPAPGACTPCGRKTELGKLFTDSAAGFPNTACCKAGTQGCFSVKEGALATECKAIIKCNTAAGESPCGRGTDRTPAVYPDNVCCSKGQRCIETGSRQGWTSVCG